MGGNITIKERLDEVSPLLLGYPDSNQEKQDQNLLCYHYTISQDIAFNEIFLVGIPGLEPGKQDQNLLCYHYTISQDYLICSEQAPLIQNCGAKVRLFHESAKVFGFFFDNRVIFPFLQYE